MMRATGAVPSTTLIWAKFAEIAAAISRHEIVRINAPAAGHAAIRAACNRAQTVPERLELFDHPHNDVWCRDHGPIFVNHATTGEVAVTDWGFNAWGGKFPPWDLDDAIPGRIAAALGLRVFPGGMILEGGAIEINGAGHLLTTEAVLLNPNRNPHLARPQIEQLLRDGLGVSDILWLQHGIDGDDTDGHIDDLARFTDPQTILACVERDPASPNHGVLEDNLARLRDFHGPNGKPFEVVEIALPQACEVSGWRLPVLPASYVNFLIVNGGVLVPTFRQQKNDDRALGHDPRDVPRPAKSPASTASTSSRRAARSTASPSSNRRVVAAHDRRSLEESPAVDSRGAWDKLAFAACKPHLLDNTTPAADGSPPSFC